jgi:hypothetical protein
MNCHAADQRIGKKLRARREEGGKKKSHLPLSHHVSTPQITRQLHTPHRQLCYPTITQARIFDIDGFVASQRTGRLLTRSLPPSRA